MTGEWRQVDGGESPHRVFDAGVAFWEYGEGNKAVSVVLKIDVNKPPEFQLKRGRRDERLKNNDVLEGMLRAWRIPYNSEFGDAYEKQVNCYEERERSSQEMARLLTLQEYPSV